MIIFLLFIVACFSSFMVGVHYGVKYKEELEGSETWKPRLTCIKCGWIGKRDEKHTCKSTIKP